MSSLILILALNATSAERLRGEWPKNAQSIDVDLTGTIAAALQEITKKAGWSLVVSTPTLDQKIAIHSAKRPLYEVLGLVLEAGDLMARIEGQTLIVKPYATPSEEEQEAAEEARDAAEQTREVADSVAFSGRRPVEWMLEHLPVDRRWCLVHATHLNDAETRGLAQSGAVAGLCPTTEANLGDGIFPLPQFRAEGGRYGIGGDSHVSRNPFEELRLLEYVQRLVLRRRNVTTGTVSAGVGTTLWLEAAAGGAQALGRTMGKIAPGCRADLVVLDAGRPDVAGRTGDKIANAAIFSGTEGLVRDVMVGGRWQVRQGHHALEAGASADYAKALKELPA